MRACLRQIVLFLTMALLVQEPPTPLHGADPAAAPSARGIDLFEKKIRPVLVERCFKCHSEEAAKTKELKGGLLLDSKAGLLLGGDSGPVIVPGNPAESLLLRAIKHDGDIKMPPSGKLPTAVIADFEAWIKMGAPDPREGATIKKQWGMSLQEGRKFWSYKPVAKPIPPRVTATDWPANGIDRFILAGLEARKLKPARDADKVTLIRRLSYDLTGLPATPEQVEAFVHDTDPGAYEALVERLLASPAFGERWGRHWLDIARFAESVTLRGFVFTEAWRYRDYVIGSFNQDVPFDRFAGEQVAGDLLPVATIADRRRQIIATTFLVLGNTNLEEQDKKQLRMDVVDEMLDVISKGFLAQTVTCARCHDHKFDPIPTKDYYALAGILRNAKAMEHANVSKWLDVPLPLEGELEAELKEHEAHIAALQAKIKAAKGVTNARPDAKGVLAIARVAGIVVDDAQAKKVGQWQNSTSSGTYIGEGYVHDQNAGKGAKTLTFQPESLPAGRYDVRLAYSPGSNRSDRVPVTVMSAEGERELTVDMKKAPPLGGRFVSLGEFRFEKDVGYVIVANENTQGHVTADAVVFIALNGDRATGSARPARPRPADPNVLEPDTIARLETELRRLEQAGPKRPLAMSVVEESKVEDARIHIRGLVANQGELVPRGFLQVAMYGGRPTLPKDQSGRVQLAQWIASDKNPLTARVIVNRAWHWLLGAGIARTVDNFGTTGEPPSHPELLDYLAARFVEDGWSLKKLVRSIVLSRTYRQSSTLEAGSATLAADPENRLFGRAKRRRLEAEAIRDTILHISGQLSAERGGPTYPADLAADYDFRHPDTRRSVYLPVFRNSLPELFEAFDFADPSMVTGQRNTSTVVSQALFMLNNPFPIEQAKHAATRLLGERLPDNHARVFRAFRLTLGRDPTDRERDVANRFVQKSASTHEAWAALFQTLFASADFRYVD